MRKIYLLIFSILLSFNNLFSQAGDRMGEDRGGGDAFGDLIHLLLWVIALILMGIWAHIRRNKDEEHGWGTFAIILVIVYLIYIIIIFSKGK